MKTILFLAVALLAAPSLDAQDHYLQLQNPPADYPIGRFTRHFAQVFLYKEHIRPRI